MFAPLKYMQVQPAVLEAVLSQQPKLLDLYVSLPIVHVSIQSAEQLGILSENQTK